MNYRLLGPLLKFNGQSDTNKWNVSVLIFYNGNKPQLICTESSNIITMKHIGVMYEYDIYRANLCIEMENSTHSKRVSYWFTFDVHSKYEIIVPGIKETPRFFFFTCNGFHSKKDSKHYGGIDKLWKQLNSIHQQNILSHLLIGGGDQIYCDEIWNIPELKNWKKKEKFIEHEAVRKAYWKLYIKHFCGQKNIGFRNTLSSIPYIFQWDDHDIFDGWGSYEDKSLQESSTFQGIFKIAKFYYLLFQHHLLPDECHFDKPLHNFYQINDIAFIGLDTRTERSPTMILSDESYNQIDELIKTNLTNQNLKYLFVIIPVPLIYSDLTILKKLSDNLLFKNLSIIQDKFGKVLYQDDLVDQWTNENHEEERKKLIHFLIHISHQYNTRIVILTGDIHSCGLGSISSTKQINFNNDQNGIYQIISSPISNSPMMNILNIVVNSMFHESNLNSILKIEMVKLRDDKYFVNERNFCSFENDKIRLYLEFGNIFITTLNTINK